MKTFIETFCDQALGIKDLSIDNIFTTGPNKFIIVQFYKRIDVQRILSNAKKLKGTEFRIHRDLTYRERIIKKKLLIVRREVINRNKEARILVRTTDLFYKNKRFLWDEEKETLIARKEENSGLLKELLDANATISLSLGSSKNGRPFVKE